MKSLADVFAASLGHELFGGSVQIYVESIKPCGVRDPFKNLCPGFSAACRGAYTWQEEQRSFDYNRLCIGLEPEFAERSEEDDGRFWTTEYNDGDFDPIAYEIMEQCDFFLAAYGLDENRILESQNFYSEENLAFRLPATAVDLLINKKIDRSIVVFKDAQTVPYFVVDEACRMVGLDKKATFKDAQTVKTTHRR